MTRFALALLALTGCIPIQTSSSMSTTSPRPAAAAPTPGSPTAASSPAAASSGELTWFVSEASLLGGPQIAVHVQPGTWLDDSGKRVVNGDGIRWSHAMGTASASVATIRKHRPLIVWCKDSWYLTAAREIDEVAGTITLESDQDEHCPPAIAIANTRVVVEFTSVPR